MAKKINTEDNPQKEDGKVSVPDVPAENITETDQEMSGPANKVEDRQTVRTGEIKGTAADETAEPHILDLLRKFSAYPSLYIDKLGGTYTPDTAAAIRGEAVLYKNPFYNELKTKS